MSEFKRVDTPSLQTFRQNITSTVSTLIETGAPRTNTEVDTIPAPKPSNTRSSKKTLIETVAPRTDTEVLAAPNPKSCA